MKKILIAIILITTSSRVFAEDFFESGKKEFYNQNYKKAEILFKRALNNNPNNYPCHYFLAHTYVHNGELSKAKEEYSRVITFAPNKTLQKLAMQSMYNLNKKEVVSVKAKVDLSDNYFDSVKMGDIYVKWKQFPIKVYVVPSEYSDLTKRAFGYWEKATDGRVSFIYERSVENAQIVARMANSLAMPQIENKFEAGVAKVQVRDGFIYKAEIELLNKSPMSGKVLGADAIYATALHEIGHALGLQGHSPNKNDIMVAEDVERRKTLTNRDINTLLMLYSK